MRRIFIGMFTLAITLGGIVMSNFAADESAIRVMSFNIRYNNPGDGINAWPNRKDKVADMIGKRHQADLAGLQEAQRDQIDDLVERLPEYAWFGVGRDDGKDAGEFTPIFYRKDRFDLLEQETFWLSETPDMPGSKSWDTAITRIATWGKFRDKKSGKEFYYINTHFDHRGNQARTESAKLIVKKIGEIFGETPTVLTGDFNVRETSDAYEVLAGKQEANGTTSILKDARYASKTGHQGPTSTFTNWEEYGPPETKIDFIFVQNGFEVLSHKVLDDRYDNRFPSDHLPVLAEIQFGE